MGQSPRHEKQRDVQAGLACAEAFQRLSEPVIYGIAEGLEEGRQGPSAAFGDLVVSAANLAFALELYLKTLLAQRDLPVPQHHNLRQLYDALPVPARDCFQSWRYIWEYTEPPDTHYQTHEFEYGLLLSACVAVRAAIIDGLADV